MNSFGLEARFNLFFRESKPLAVPLPSKRGTSANVLLGIKKWTQYACDQTHFQDLHRKNLFLKEKHLSSSRYSIRITEYSLKSSRICFL